MEKKLPKSIRKFISSEKARIRRQFLDVKKQDELIEDLYKKVKSKVNLNEPKEKKVAKKDTTAKKGKAGKTKKQKNNKK